MTATYHAIKTVLYFIFILRIKMAFDQSAFKYSNTVIYSYFSMLFCFIIIFIIGDLIFTNSRWQYDSSDIPRCQSIFPLWGALLTVLSDIILSLIPLYLTFTRPLYILCQKKLNQYLEYPPQFLLCMCFCMFDVKIVCYRWVFAPTFCSTYVQQVQMQSLALCNTKNNGAK